jgi:hypothetical protein
LACSDEITYTEEITQQNITTGDSPSFSVKDFGAKGDGAQMIRKHSRMQSKQRSKQGGVEVIVPIPEKILQY